MIVFHLTSNPNVTNVTHIRFISRPMNSDEWLRLVKVSASDHSLQQLLKMRSGTGHSGRNAVCEGVAR